jgi:hypothetical protein|tara:strand:+ start:1099 stop:1335 length:237 start_codon:yes stop_codon:yes gene_type:complete
MNFENLDPQHAQELNDEIEAALQASPVPPLAALLRTRRDALIALIAADNALLESFDILPRDIAISRLVESYFKAHSQQ